MKVDQRRYRLLNSTSVRNSGRVVYWMSREQRVKDNWALLFAVEQANSLNVPLEVVFCLQQKFANAQSSHFRFMLEGLSLVSSDLEKNGIMFTLLFGNPEDEIVKYVNQNKASVLICDFTSLREGRRNRDKISIALNIPVYEVDGRNIVPCFISSNKQEWGAYTIRPKILRLLPEFLIDIPNLINIKNKIIQNKKIDWQTLLKKYQQNKYYPPSGEKFAHQQLCNFIDNTLGYYEANRNDPLQNATSHLSPFLHFGQISSQRIALQINKVKSTGTKSFLEELIIRRELSDNFCFNNPSYDSFEGFPAWAKKTLKDHEKDKREYVYSRDILENCETHDELWNASQKEIVLTGYLHGYLRMYWVKKILEWSEDVQMAISTAIYLNDKYQLDGRDANGYTGIAWAIGGVHDRPWFERPIFGKIRYMNYKGCERKFNVQEYIKRVKEL